MKLKEIEFDKSNKAIKFNTRLTFISTLFIVAFYFFPAFAIGDAYPKWFIIRFFVYFLLYIKGIDFLIY